MATFVLIHGAGDTRWFWQRVEAELQARGHDTIAPDLPCDNDTATLDDYVGTVLGAAASRSDLVIVGQSYGAFTAALAASQLPAQLLVLLAAVIPAPGETPAQWWAQLARARMRRRIPDLEEALVGRFSDHHAFLCRRHSGPPGHHRGDRCPARRPDRRRDRPVSGPARPAGHHPGGEPAHRPDHPRRGRRGHDPVPHPRRAGLLGGDVPGQQRVRRQHHGGRTRKGDSWLRRALGESAAAAARTKNTYLAARYRRLAARRGNKRALIAVGHSILIAVWHILATDATYTDLGGDFFLTRIDRERATQRLVGQLHQLGYTVTLELAQPA